MPPLYSSIVEQLIRDKMSSGLYASEEELLIVALKSLEECDQEWRAIEAGLASVDRGEEGVELNEAVDRLRQKHSIRDQT